MQLNLFNQLQAPKELTAQELVAWIIRQYPQAASDDATLVIMYWWHIEGLDAVMTPEQRDALMGFWQRRTTSSPSTITRRRRELQRLMSGGSGDDLAPTPTVAKRRKQRYKAGPPRKS